jgi:fused signal recognition particle receptor
MADDVNNQGNPEKSGGGLLGRFRKKEKNMEEPAASVQVPDAAPIQQAEENSKWRRLFKGGDKTAQAATASQNEKPDIVVEGVATPETDSPEKSARKIRNALSRTSKGLGEVFLGKKVIDQELIDDLETQLLTTDLGIEVTAQVIDQLADRVKRRKLDDVNALQKALHKILTEILKPCEKPLDIGSAKPFVMMVVGVNGVGKTTTIGKLARQFLNRNKSVMLAAGDTFRAAAVEQLQVWGERNQVPVVAQHTGADSASVIFDATASAQAKAVDLLIADTAGRLHTKSNLMEELKKIKRVVTKVDGSAPHEILLVLDAGTGQNAMAQMEQFHEAVGVTGIVLTKLDGTAKGGVIFALCSKYGVPVRYIGVGEGVDDLQPFVAEDFVSALLSQQD